MRRRAAQMARLNPMAMLAAVLLLAACDSSDNSTPTGPGDSADEMILSESQPDLVSGELQTDSGTVQAVTTSLTAAEVEGMQFMREEEKLAHDVYRALFDAWQIQAFANIADAELRHTDSVRDLLEEYALRDPAIDQPIGTFTDTALQRLHDDLLVLGSQSLADALRVGTAIEEIDILDLLERIAHTDKPDILQVYEALLSGSYNHLRAFASVIKTQTGETYAPQFLDRDSYDAILEQEGPGRANRYRTSDTK